MSFTPVNGKIAVRFAETKTTESGIVIPDNALTERVVKGTVIAVSRRLLASGTWADPIADVGDTVTYLKGQGIPIKDVDGSDILVLSPEDVIGKYA